MYNLVSANSWFAIYNNDGLKDKEVSPYKYLDRLLSIRSAEGLVRFIIEFPDGLIRPEPNCKNVDHDQNAYKHVNRLFSESRYYSIQRMEKAFKSNGITFFPDETLSVEQHLKKVDFSVLDLKGVLVLKDKILRILRLAMQASGEIGYDEQFIKEGYITDFSTDFSIEWDQMLDIMPLGMEEDMMLKGIRLWNDLKKNDLRRIRHVRLSCDSRPRRSKEIIVHVESGNKDLSFQYCMTEVVCFVLTQWMNYYNTPYFIDVDQTKPGINGMTLTQPKTNEVVLELVKTVIEGRFGICPICKKPYIYKRSEADRESRKMYCSNSCKQTAAYRIRKAKKLSESLEGYVS